MINSTVAKFDEIVLSCTVANQRIIFYFQVRNINHVISSFDLLRFGKWHFEQIILTKVTSTKTFCVLVVVLTRCPEIVIHSLKLKIFFFNLNIKVLTHFCRNTV